MRLTIFLISALLPLSFAQTSDVSNSTTHSVQVGGSGLIFIPNTVNAAVRDQVQFHFYPYNHSVVQSTYDAPCMAIAGGIYSGFVPVKSGESRHALYKTTIFTVTINDTNPIWLYCSQNIDAHCQAGMAMVINPPISSSSTLAAYIEAAGSTNTSTSDTRVTGGIIGTNSTSTNSTSSSGPTSSSTATSMSVTTSTSISQSTNTAGAEMAMGKSGVGFSTLGAIVAAGIWALGML
ncbi:hypothetical protein MMC12_007546 [Toensbergia leucococca]|nr:hypothetical protein [Toensbergia leucococca]